ncbi:MAG: hypothetical protein JKY37_00635 [Nannocystaceae bacterium]|nr:hypothetical protein [Nannocystaceae bacterium]
MTYADLLAKHQPRILDDEEKYQAALKTVSGLMRECGTTPGPELHAVLDLCALFITKYEDEHHPAIPSVEPHEIVGHLLQERGGDVAALAADLGMPVRSMSGILSGTLPITVEAAKSLGNCSSLPPSLFLGID